MKILLTALMAISMNTNAEGLTLDQKFVRFSAWAAMAGNVKSRNLFANALTTSSLEIADKSFQVGFASGLVFSVEPKHRPVIAGNYYNHICPSLESLAASVIDKSST